MFPAPDIARPPTLSLPPRRRPHPVLASLLIAGLLLIAVAALAPFMAKTAARPATPGGPMVVLSAAGSLPLSIDTSAATLIICGASGFTIEASTPLYPALTVSFVGLRGATTTVGEGGGVLRLETGGIPGAGFAFVASSGEVYYGPADGHLAAVLDDESGRHLVLAGRFACGDGPTRTGG